MIRRKTDAGWLLFTQPDHARVAGELAGHWGNAEFARPEPREDVLLAVAEHDNGWRELDEVARFNPENGLPYHFAEWPLTEHFDTWRRAEKRFLDRSPYASILISRHGSVLFRYLVDKKADPRLAHPFFAVKAWRSRGEQMTEEQRQQVFAFAEEREEFQSRVRGTLSNGGFEAAALEADTLNENFKLLQTCDALSLYLALEPPTEKELPGICRGGWDDPVDMTLTPVSEKAAVLDPFPFGSSPLKVEITGRQLPPGPFANEEELVRTWEEAPEATMEFTFLAEK